MRMGEVKGAEGYSRERERDSLERLFTKRAPYTMHTSRLGRDTRTQAGDGYKHPSQACARKILVTASPPFAFTRAQAWQETASVAHPCNGLTSASIPSAHRGR